MAPPEADTAPADPDSSGAARPPVDDRWAGVEGTVVRVTSAWGREVLAVIERAAVETAKDREARQLARKVTLPGFRPGKAPPARVRVLHAETVNEQAIGSLAGQALREARERQPMRVVGEPRLVAVDDRQDQPLRLAVLVEVLPEVQVGDLDGVRATDRKVKVTEADVDDEIARVRLERATLVDPGREEAAPGDFAVVDVEHWPAGTRREQLDEIEPASARRGQVVEIGGGQVTPELERALLGMGVGERRVFEARPHAESTEAGAVMPFRVTLQGVRERRLPEVDAEFLRAVGNFESEAALRAKVREHLLADRRRQARRSQEDEVLGQVMERHPVEMPPSLVDAEAERSLTSLLQGLARRGIDPAKVDADWKQEFERQRAQAARGLAAEYLLDRIAEARGIEVTDADVAAEIERAAAARGTSAAEFKAALRRSGRPGAVAVGLRRARALDLLLSGATISEE